MAQIRVGCITRHTLTGKQTEDLDQFLREKGILQNGDHIYAIKNGIRWAASTNAEEDNRINLKKWEDLIEEFDVIVGQFPTVARTSKPEGLQIFTSIPIKQNGTTTHARWEEEK